MPSVKFLRCVCKTALLAETLILAWPERRADQHDHHQAPFPQDCSSAEPRETPRAETALSAILHATFVQASTAR